MANTTKVAPLRTDTLADSVIILLGLTAVQRLVGFGRGVLFCRWLEPGELGRWDMAFSFLMLAAPVAVLSLSSCLGRYVEHYRARGQLRTLVRRTAILCALLAVPAAGLIGAARTWFSQLIFGTPGQAELVVALASSLLAVIVLHYFIDLFNALRNIRLIAGLEVINSFLYAGLAICLLLGWQCSALSVVLAYGGSAALCSLGAFLWLRGAWRAFPEDTAPLPHRDLWARVIPFTTWMVLSSLLANLFQVADRYMILHYSSMPAAEALVQVGNYHSSRIVPLLLVSIALMLAAMIAPHLSHDWEAGKRDRAAARLRLFLKLLGFALSAAAVTLLFAAPLLFGVAFQNKFAGGLAVLPWTLIYCMWFGLAMVAQDYLWCAEKARLGSLALLIGLLVNIGLNLLLLPRLGLLGAVLATTAANLVALVLICLFNHLLGFRLDRGGWVILALPLAVCLGRWTALLALMAVAFAAVRSGWLLSPEEKRQLADGWSDYSDRLRRFWIARKPVESRSR